MNNDRLPASCLDTYIPTAVDLGNDAEFGIIAVSGCSVN